MNNVTNYYAQHYADLVSVVIRMTGLPRQVVEDIVSDAYLAEMVSPKKAATLSPKARVMIRVRQKLKKFINKPIKFLPLVKDLALEETQTSIQADFLPETLRELKAYMPLNFRVIYMRYYDGMEDAVICERLGFDEVGEVKNKVRRGLEFLAREIQVKVGRFSRSYQAQERRKRVG